MRSLALILTLSFARLACGQVSDIDLDIAIARARHDTPLQRSEPAAKPIVKLQLAPAKPIVKAAPRLAYPEYRQPGPHWNENGHAPSAEHLMQGMHNFPWEWLKTLNQAQLNALHDDSHNGKVQWQYVPKLAVARVRIQPSRTILNYAQPQSNYFYCPACNGGRGGWLRRR